MFDAIVQTRTYQPQNKGYENSILKSTQRLALGIFVTALFLATGCSDQDALWTCTYRTNSAKDSAASIFTQYQVRSVNKGCDSSVRSDIDIGTGVLKESTRIW